MKNEYEIIPIEREVIRRFPKARKPHSLSCEDLKKLGMMKTVNINGKLFYSTIVDFVCEWREFKQIYDFDPDLEQELCSNFQEDFEYPSDLFSYLPCKVFVVKTKDEEYIVLAQPERRNCVIYPIKSQFEVSIELSNEETSSFNEFSRVNELSKDFMDKIETKFPKIKERREAYEKDKIKICKKIFPLIFYLAYTNADITPYKPTKPHKKPVGTVQQAVQVSNVGVRIGAALRQTKRQIKEVETSETDTGETKPRKKMISHVRRGHPHRYWCNAEDGTKKLVVRWVETMVINGNIETATIHNVE